MILSEAISNKVFRKIEVSSLEELASVMTKKQISAGVFKDDHRTNRNFEGADFMLLDVDDGCSLDEAIVKFSKYKYAIATTRSHRKHKGGKVADRFRVALQLENRITSTEDYKATYLSLIEEFPFVDEKCKDPARMFYASPKLVKYNEDGETVKLRKWVPKEIKETKEVLVKKVPHLNTLKFLTFGASAGTWNHELNKAVYDLRQCGYSIEEVLELTKKPTGYLTEADERTIQSVFNGEVELIVEPSPFNFVKIKDLLNSGEKVEWLVEGLLTRGGFSLIAGEPKSGKSTIVRQLTKCIVKGDYFLGRKVEPGKVLYLALEEQAAMLKEQFARVGITDEDDVTVHVGSVNGEQRFEYLKQYCVKEKPDFVVIDTMALFMQFENLNDYSLTNGPLAKVRDITREAGCHIILVHHTNKGENRGTASIMGSGAIHGSVDCAIIFNRFGEKRSITTSQRGGSPFYKNDLIFDNETETYYLDKEKVQREF